MSDGFSLFSDLLSFLLRKTFFSELCLAEMSIETRKGKKEKERASKLLPHCGDDLNFR